MTVEWSSLLEGQVRPVTPIRFPIPVLEPEQSLLFSGSLTRYYPIIYPIVHGSSQRFTSGSPLHVFAFPPLPLNPPKAHAFLKALSLSL